MRAAGVPLVPGTEGVASLAEIRDRRRRARLPGAAQGDRRAAAARACASSTRPEDLEAAYGAASAEAEAAFGDGSLYLERALVPARHVEIQVLCDTQGGVLTLGERECSIQRRHQKLDRGVAVAGAHARDARGDGGVGRARLPPARLRQRRHVRVPARPRRRAVVHRGQLPPAGRASRHRDDDRHRHRARAAAHRGRRAADRDRAGRRARGTRSRSGSTPRIRAATSRRRPGRSRGSGRRSAPACASTRP